MLVDDVRARLRERLAHLELGTKSNDIKTALENAGLSESYLDQILNGRKGGEPIDPTITRIEKVAVALSVPLPWLLLGQGKPDAFYSPRPEAASAPIIGLRGEMRARERAKLDKTAAATKDKGRSQK